MASVETGDWGHAVRRGSVDLTGRAYYAVAGRLSGVYQRTGVCDVSQMCDVTADRLRL